ncbi:hypothetical protein QYM36_017102 [Artemia franciscana]|uniref:Endonuclease/exonuclease/phosphatase domain-containing protein n=1 Tax=Artemia franciscana TaxID=6661 RepID=A0AA88KSL8_ARTSF|nr:hypothetical protein QYM36_017102 [Artemia franciscana]
MIWSLRTVPNCDPLILRGDLNSHVGSREIDRERAVGIVGWGDGCERVWRIVEFSQQHNLVLENMLFQHKPSPRMVCVEESQVDFLLISTRYRSSILNCRATVEPMKQIQHPPRHHLARLHDKAVTKEFRLALSNHLDILYMDDDNEPTTINIDDEWMKIRDAITNTSKKVLDWLNRKRKKWISEDTIKLLNQKQYIGYRVYSVQNTEKRIP